MVGGGDDWCDDWWPMVINGGDDWWPVVINGGWW